MRYFATPSSPAVRQAMYDGLLDCSLSPGSNHVPKGVRYMADNGRFGKGWPGYGGWWRWLRDRTEMYGRAQCAFATAPDTVGDAEATLRGSLTWLAVIDFVGVPPSFVAQDGVRKYPPPWGFFDILFLGGSDEFKLGPEGVWVTEQALERGIPVHMGRVNTRRRLRYAHSIGCTSVDGTLLAFGPDYHLPRLLGWLAELAEEARSPARK